MAIADTTAKNNQANIGTKKTEVKLDVIGDETKKTSSWLAKIFGLQEGEIMRQKERDREADRAGKGAGAGAGEAGRQQSKLGKMLGMMLKPLLLTFKAIGKTFAMLGKLVKSFAKFAVFLVKPLLFAWGALTYTITSVKALLITLGLLVAAFAGITIASMTMSKKDFDNLKMDIADGIAGAIRSTVRFAMNIWNDYTPKSWNIDPETQKSFEDATFKGVSDTIVAIFDFAKELGDAFGEGFGTQMESFKQSWKDFKEVFDRIFDLFSGGVDKVGEFDVGGKIKTGVLAGAKVIGAAITFISEFFLDLATALGSTMVLREKAETDNVLINAVANILGKVINFVKDLFAAFGKGFISKFDKISESLQGTKESFGRLFDFAVDLWNKAKEIIGSIGGGEATGPSKSLLAAFTRFGELVGDMVASIFDIITIIMDFIVNPEEISGRARANVVNLFEDIGDAITDVFGSLFSTESIMSMLQAVLPETMFKGLEYAFGSLEEIAEQSILDKGTEIQSLQDENKAIAEDVALSKKLLAEELAKKEEDRSKEVIENLSYDIQVNERRIERNIEGAKSLEEDIENSKKTRDKQRLARMIEEEMGESAVAQLKAVEDLKDKIEDSADRFKTGMGIGGVGFGSTIKLSDLDAFREIIGDTDINKLSKKQIRQFKSRGVAADDISSAMEQLEAKERELAANREALRLAQDKVRQMEEVVKVRLAKELDEGKGHTGGLITKGGAILAQKGEVLIDDILVQNLNNAAHVLAELQRTHSLSGGNNPIIIQDNSQKQVNQSQPVIIPPPSIQPGNADSPNLLN